MCQEGCACGHVTSPTAHSSSEQPLISPAWAVNAHYAGAECKDIEKAGFTQPSQPQRALYICWCHIPNFFTLS